jgi:ABC-2 type transport system ATP-binding protein/ribosome-dependent ATPase
MLLAENLTRRFGDFTAVDDANLTVDAGEVVGLIGANGAGKTTLIRMALGLLRPSEGEVLLFGEPPSISTRRRIGYVPQGLGLYEDLTVEENLSFVARSFGVEPNVDLATLGGGNRLVRDLPLGLKRRVAFAAAFVHSPELLVLDEPTSGVGPLARTHLWDGIREAASRGAGVLVTTHHMGEAEQCDRVVVMVAGRVAAAGTMEELAGDSKVVEVQSDSWAEVFNALDDAGFSLALKGRRVRVIDASVEDVQSVLEERGIGAEPSLEAATFEETFVSMSRTA